ELLVQEKRRRQGRSLRVTGFTETLSSKIPKKPILAVVLACLTLAASAASAQAPPNQTLIFEGPGGRTPLNEWVLRRDPANRGLGLGWAKGVFTGQSVKVPNVVNPTPYSGKPGGRNYQGSVAWYRTTFRAAVPGLYAISFQSANYRAEVF